MNPRRSPAAADSGAALHAGHSAYSLFVPASLRSGLHHERRQTYAFRNGWAEGRPDIGADRL
jgi:hypothetical protein